MKKNYHNILVLTGAGISAESGLATFRGSNGLWNGHKVEDVATIDAFERNPEYVHRFYNELKPAISEAKPNPAHLALAKLEKEYTGRVDIITQNVDTLHEKAGNNNVWHIHGQIDQAVCLNCGEVVETWGEMNSQSICPKCHLQGKLKPNIVFFGEQLLYMDHVEKLLRQCDLFLSVGTSGVVYPAAGFVQIAKLNGADTYEFNLEPSANSYLFDHHSYGLSGTTLPPFVNELINQNKNLSE